MQRNEPDNDFVAIRHFPALDSHDASNLMGSPNEISVVGCKFVFMFQEASSKYISSRLPPRKSDQILWINFKIVFVARLMSVCLAVLRNPWEHPSPWTNWFSSQPVCHVPLIIRNKDSSHDTINQQNEQENLRTNTNWFHSHCWLRNASNAITFTLLGR